MKFDSGELAYVKGCRLCKTHTLTETAFICDVDNHIPHLMALLLLGSSHPLRFEQSNGGIVFAGQ